MSFAYFTLLFSFSVSIFFLRKFLIFVVKPQFSPLRSLRGPKRGSWIWGNRKLIWKEDQLGLFERWEEEFGSVFVYKVFLNADRLYISDLRAVNYILTHTYIFQRPEQSRVILGNILGDGILVTEGDLHKKQRRILNPCFNAPSIQNLTPIFFEKAIKLQHIWERELGSGNGSKKLDAFKWLSRTTLDIIGAAGFNYELGSLDIDESQTELAHAFRQLLHRDEMMSFGRLVRALFPLARIIPSEFARREEQAREKMLQIGRELLRQRKAYNANSCSDDDKHCESHREYNSEHHSKGSYRNDLLTVLVEANEDMELPETQRMSDEEVVAQVPTFIVTGHETTSTELSWVLFSLSTHPEIKQRLRTELLACPSSTPSTDELNSLVYLDAVIRETLRLHPAVPSTTRVAMHDVDVPVSTPYMDKRGKKCSHIKISEGEGLLIPILQINRSKEIWGDDALEFKPDRWAKLPKSVESIPGLFGNTMSFLGGAKGCVGYRFAVTEMKAILFTLVRNFEFSLAVPTGNIEKRCVIVARPYVKGQAREGAQLPLLMSRYQRNSDMFV